MFEQEQMFPKTELDEAHAVLSKLLADQEKAENAVDNAEKKLSEIETLTYKQRHVIKRLQSMMPPAGGASSAEAIEEVEVIDEGVSERREPLATEGDVLDPITGEVVSLKSGDEKCEAVEPHVFVVWPHCNDAVRTEVGEHTTYGELVADYLSSTVADGGVEDFNVLSWDGSIRPLNATVIDADYGREFRIQEKATEAQEPAA